MTNEWFEQVCMSALGHRTSQEQTYDIARLVLQRGIPGDFVECGVYAGASCALMARAIMDTIPGVTWDEEYLRVHEYIGPRVHLFDSFSGIPAPGPHDTELADNVGGESAVSFEDVRDNMKRWSIPHQLLTYHPGLFVQTVPFWSGRMFVYHGAIALLRLDGDLYESTRVCMEHLYPLVSPGGYVIVDDFNLSGCRKAVLEAVNPAPMLWRKPA